MRVIHDLLYIKDFNELFGIKEKSREIINARTTLSSRNRAKRPSGPAVFSRGTIVTGPEKRGANTRCEMNQTRSIAGFWRGADDRDHLGTTTWTGPSKLLTK